MGMGIAPVTQEPTFFKNPTGWSKIPFQFTINKGWGIKPKATISARQAAHLKLPIFSI